MKLIDKLVLKDLIGPFLNGIFMFMLLVFTAGFLFQATTLLVQGVPFVTVMKFILYVLPSIVTQTFPMAMLLGALLGFGRLSADKEAIAIFAAGISFPRIARSVLVMGLLVSIFAFLWNDLVVPPASTAAAALRRNAILGRAKSDLPMSFPMVSDEDKTTIERFIKIDHGFDAHTNTVRGVTILQFSKDPAHLGQIEIEVYCDHAIVNGQTGMDWKYYQGYVKIPFWDKTTGKLESVEVQDFDTLEALPKGATIGKSFSEIINLQRVDSDTKSFRELRDEIRAENRKTHRMHGIDKETLGKEVDLYGKIALPLASIIFGLVGAALGISTQRGASRTVGFGMALFIVFIYWVFYRAMFVVGAGGNLPPMFAAFAADIVGLTVGLVLAYRASR